MELRLNGWSFVPAGSARDATRVAETLIERNRLGYDGTVSSKWEDNDAGPRPRWPVALRDAP
jgi:hypothetical protein